MSIEPQRHGQTIIFPASLDPDAVSVVKRLVDAGFESYLVGGCVRDLLCGMIPKDFDVSTAARPRQIRSRFRNCRVIGRRFKLAHVHFGDKIIEVATFRRTPDEQADEDEGDDLLIVRDNEYGTAEEDALRRDFTINALLYDVNSDEVIDYVGGVADLEQRVLRTIGDPHIRLAEDPVRMLRAVKFASRLGLTFEEGLEQAMRDSAELIAKSSPPRVLEEIYKLLSCGKAARALPMLAAYGLLAHLLPEFAPWWLEHPETLESLGAALDIVDHGTRRLSNAFLLSALTLEPWRASLDGEGVDPMAAAGDLLAPAARRMSIPRRDVAIAKQLLTLQPRLERNKRNRRVKMADFLGRPVTRQAIDLLYLSSLAGTADPAMHALWARRLAERDDDQQPRESPTSSEERPPRKRRRRRRRGGRSRSGGQAPDGESAAQDTTPQDEEGSGQAETAPAEAPRSPKPRRPRPEPAAEGGREEAPKQTPPAHEAGNPSAAPAADLTGAPAAASTPPTPEPQAGPASDDTPPPGGLRGLLHRVVKRLRPAAGETEAGSPGSSPQSASGPAKVSRSQSQSRAEPQQPAPRQASDARTDRDTPTGTEAPPTKEPAEASGESPVSDAPSAADTAGSADTTAPADRPKRRRRRRSRGGRGGRKSAARDDTRDDTGDENGGGSPENPDGDSSEGSSSKRSRRRRGGSRRSRSRSSGASSDKAQAPSGESDAGSDGGEASSGSGGSGKSSGRRAKRTRSDRGRGKSEDDREPKSSSPKEPPPVHQRPEDIEDYFDW